MVKWKGDTGCREREIVAALKTDSVNRTEKMWSLQIHEKDDILQQPLRNKLITLDLKRRGATHLGAARTFSSTLYRYSLTTNPDKK